MHADRIKCRLLASQRITVRWSAQLGVECCYHIPGMHAVLPLWLHLEDLPPAAADTIVHSFQVLHTLTHALLS
jgi:hypothetical protein